MHVNVRLSKRGIWSSLLCILLCFGCTKSGEEDPNGNGNNNGNNHNDPIIKWSQPMQVDLEDAGLQLELRTTPDDQFAIAYYKRYPEVGECTEPILGNTSSTAIKDTVAYARYDGSSWHTEEVITIETSILSGITLTFQDDTPLIAYLGGEEGSQICGGTDLMINRRTGVDTWAEQTVAESSNDALAGGDCPKGQNICDFGDAVGLWASMAKSSDGSTIGILYRDIHNGYTMEANNSSDLEYAYNSGGGWQHEWIDLARGAGSYNCLAFDSQDVPVAAYYNGPHGTIHFAKRPWAEWTQGTACTHDYECESPRICVGDRCAVTIEKFATGFDHKGISLAIGSDGRYLVAYQDPDDKNLMIAHSQDGITWQKGLVDADGVTGMYPSLFIEPVDGKPQIAYYRCNKYPPTGTGCHDDFDGVRFAYFTGTYPDELNDQAKWKKSVVSNDTVAMDGPQVSAAVLPDGRVGIAYYYSWQDPGDNQTKIHLMFRLGEWESSE